MGQKCEYVVNCFITGKKTNNQSCVDDFAKDANEMAIRGFRLVSSVYDSRWERTSLFYERRIGDE